MFDWVSALWMRKARAGERTFQAEGTACTKASSLGEDGDPEVSVLNAFKICNSPTLCESILLSTQLELKAEGTVDQKDQNSSRQVPGKARHASPGKQWGHRGQRMGKYRV